MSETTETRKTFTPDELREILAKHNAWHRGEATGERANLAGAYLARANLARDDRAPANLAHANLARANLAGADLARANLEDADLAGAYLARANLADAENVPPIEQTASAEASPERPAR